MKIMNILLYILLEFILLSSVIFLGLKIYYIKSDMVKGILYVTKINKNELITEADNEFNFFYEPKPNTINIWSPDWLDFTVVNKINSDSLNEAKDFTFDKRRETFRIITIGDSFTYGQYVLTINNYPKKLEYLLNKNIKCRNYSNFEIINFGVGGYDISYTYKRFKHRGLKYNPDLVIWLINPHNFYTYNDLIIPIKNEFQSNCVLDFNSKTQQFIAINQAIKQINRIYGSDYMTELSIQNLLKFKEFYKRKTLFLSLDDLPVNQQNILSEIISDSNYIYASLKLDFFSNKKLQFLDSHPNPLGYEIIASAIYKYLSNNNIIGCMEYKRK